MTTSCTEIEDLLPALALDALSVTDRLEALEHIAECRQHDADLTAYRAVAARLPEVLDASEPPSRLRAGILAGFDSAIRGVTANGTESRSPASRFRLPAYVYAAAAVLLLALTAGLVAWNLSLQGDGGSEVIHASVQHQGMTLELIYIPASKIAIVDVELPALAQGQVYQVWRITGAGPESVGLLLDHEGASVFRPVDFASATALALSIEPAGGSQLPTTEPVLVAQLDF